MTLITEKDVKLSRRKKDARKGDAGHVLIVGGSEDFVGAPILAAKAAFRAGADFVTVIAPRKVAWIINTYDASIMTKKLASSSFSKKDVPAVLRAAEKATAVLIGNGLGRGLRQKGFVRELLKKLDKPVVIDADALHAAFLREMKSGLVVCTPHRKEYEVLLRNNKEMPAGVVILKKGPVDTIMIGRKRYENRTGVPEMAVAGTGDVLAGLVAGFLAQRVSPLQATVNAAYLNGKAGEKAKRRHGNFTAEELIDALVIRQEKQ